jgi:hypothetical protein
MDWTWVRGAQFRSDVVSQVGLDRMDFTENRGTSIAQWYHGGRMYNIEICGSQSHPSQGNLIFLCSKCQLTDHRIRDRAINKTREDK